MKRKLPVLIAIAVALIILLAACQPHNNPATAGGQADILPTNQTVPPTEPVQTQPVDAPVEEPAPTTPVTTEPVATEPATTLPVATDPAPAEPKPTKPATTPSKELTKDEAISKALSHAGLKKSQVSRLKAEPDLDNGVVHYDVEFETAQWEYDYEIHAETGKVLQAEKDRND